MSTPDSGGDRAKAPPAPLQSRIAAFEAAAAAAVDPHVMAAKISAKSDRKKYDFASGLRRDLAQTRAALRRGCSSSSYAEEEEGVECAVGTEAVPSSTLVGGGTAAATAAAGAGGCRITTFGALFEYTGGRIANLNRVLQNLRNAGEVSFRPECFFIGVHDDEEIRLLDRFWAEEYDVDADNVFRPGNGEEEVPDDERRGRSYVAENLSTMEVCTCTVCGGRVKAVERMTVRAEVYHLRCLSCTVCGASLRQKKDYITFDGGICCGADCVRQYDGAHVDQKRR